MKIISLMTSKCQASKKTSKKIVLLIYNIFSYNCLTNFTLTGKSQNFIFSFKAFFLFWADILNLFVGYFPAPG